MNNRSIYKMILEGEDIDWQSVIYELVRTGKVDPWDMDISNLTNEYIKVIRNLERLSFNLSGKVVLAAALLLKLKTRELGLQEFIALSETSNEDTEFQDQEEQVLKELVEKKERRKPPQLQSNLPGPRTRGVTVFELVSALKKAINIEEKRQQKLDIREAVVQVPKKHTMKKIDIYGKIIAVYARIKEVHFKLNKKTMEFDQLLPSREKKDVIWTFVPLLHLANEDKLLLHQDIPFGKIWVQVRKIEDNLEMSKV